MTPKITLENPAQLHCVGLLLGDSRVAVRLAGSSEVIDSTATAFDASAGRLVLVPGVQVEVLASLSKLASIRAASELPVDAALGDGEPAQEPPAETGTDVTSILVDRRETHGRVEVRWPWTGHSRRSAQSPFQ